MRDKEIVAKGLVLIASRGGHLHNALMLREQMRVRPEALITTSGPEVESVRRRAELAETRVIAIPLAFTWIDGNRRFLNPLKLLYQAGLSLWLAIRLRPRAVISLGASDVIPFCYFAKLFGARIYHVDVMNAVTHRSQTGRLL